MIPSAVPHERPDSLFGIVKAVVQRFGRHNVTVFAAGIAFYAVLALVPTIIAAALTFASVVEPSELEDWIVDQAQGLGPTTRDFIVEQLLPDVMDQVADARSSGTIAIVAALALALFSASGAVQKLMAVTAAAYEVPETRAGWKMRLFAYGTTAAAIVVLGVLVAALGVLPLLGDELGLGEFAQQAISFGVYPIAAVVLMLAFTFLYRYSPDRDPRTPWLNIGAVVATVLFLLIAYGFTAFSTQVANLGAAGVIGSVAVLMLFFQFSTIAIVLGAELNAVLEPRNSRAEAQQAAEQMASAAHTTAASGPVPEAEPVPFGQALAAVAALLILGRNDS